MPRLSRRRFIRSAAAAGAAFSTFTIAGTKASGRVIGANDTIRIGLAGINGRGRAHLGGFAGMDKVEITHLIDPDSRLFASRTKMVEEKGGNRPACVQDIRSALDNPEIDAISIATPNHWHSLMTIWACQAGKHVYVEKPMSHNMFEGRQCVAAAKKYGRVVQHGTQQRSDESRAQEIAAVQSGNYGKLLVSKGYCCKQRWSIGSKPVQSPPSELDFDLWTGPAPEQDYHDNLVHYNWHWFWDFGNGDTGNQGVHEMDVARWAIKGAEMPHRVWSLGGRFGYQDQGQTPNTQLSVYEYDDATLLFETRGLVERHEGFERQVLNEYYTTEGVIRQGNFHPHGGGSAEPVTGGTPDKIIPGGMFGSFINTIRSGNSADCNADAEDGHYSSALCHLANISYQLGEAAPFNKQAQSIGDNKQVVESFEKVQANCRAVGMNLDESTYMLGRPLDFDPVSEKFSSDAEANALMTRNYRAPFVVPEDV